MCCKLNLENEKYILLKLLTITSKKFQGFEKNAYFSNRSIVKSYQPKSTVGVNKEIKWNNGKVSTSGLFFCILFFSYYFCFSYNFFLSDLLLSESEWSHSRQPKKLGGLSANQVCVSTKDTEKQRNLLIIKNDFVFQLSEECFSSVDIEAMQ